MRIKYLLLTLMAVIASSALAQTGDITGKVVSRLGRSPISGARVIFTTDVPKEVKTDDAGMFELESVPYGTHRLVIIATDYLQTEVSVRVSAAHNPIDLITLSPSVVNTNIDEDALAEFDSDQSSDAQSMSVLISSSTDVFDRLANYNFNALRFRPRGYDTGLNDVYMNGVYMNDALTSYSPWSLWTGLNDATRNQESTSGLTFLDYGVGGLNGTTNINARASKMRKGFRASVLGANATYRARIMVSYASQEKNGWTWAVSASTRQGHSEWVDGLYYNAFSYFASVEKKLNENHTLALTAFGAPTVRGVQSAAVPEVYRLLDDNYYNPNWGWQDGKKRNARVRNYHEPVVMLNHDWVSNNKKTEVASALSFRFGKNGYSAMDWGNVADPRPDYYRNLPSYYDEGSIKHEELKESWLSDVNARQINWDKMYDINLNAGVVENKTSTGPKSYRRALYVQEERRTDQRDFNLSVQAKHELNDRERISGGITARINRTEYYKRMKDLLGGEYWLDVDKYAERDHGADSDEAQNDLNNPNRLISKGDKYGYDYYAHLHDYKLWGAYNYEKPMYSFYAGANVGYTRFWREGLYQKGLFKDNSKGNSDKKHFMPFTLKVGGKYRLDGFHSLSANAMYMHRSPTFNRAFTSARTRNTLVNNLKTDKILSGDLNYEFRSRWLQLRATIYWTQIKDQTKIISFYNEATSTDGLSQAGYTNYAMSGIDQKHRGFELGFRLPIIKNLALSGAYSYGIFKYSNNPYVQVTLDKTDGIVSEDVVRWKDYHVAGTPQTAASLQLDYRTDNYWFFTLNGNFFDRQYQDLNPVRRTDVALVGMTDEEIHSMTHQREYPSSFVMNASIGKSWYIQRKYNVGFNLSANNILNRRNIITNGFEQMRVLESRFDAKQYYMMGTTYSLMAYFRF